MTLESKSQKLKDLISTYDTQWFLGDLSGLIMNIANGAAYDQLGQLSSPLRQLYFLGGLLITSDASEGLDIQYDPEKWGKIVLLLNEIEKEYDKLFFPNPDAQIDEEWKKIRSVAMPSFLSYFNQGPLNYEEQVINWVRDLFTSQDPLIEHTTGLKTEDFIQFYNNLDNLIQHNFQCYMSPHYQLKDNWKQYTKIEMINTALPELGAPPEKVQAFYHFMSDKGIMSRFYPEEIVSHELPIEKVNIILGLLCTNRMQREYLYYTSTKPGNPLYEKPIIDIGANMFQVFEVKQVIHSIENLLEQICTTTKEAKTKYKDGKGKLLEENIVKLFAIYLKKDFKVHVGYYVDGCEQDILILWKKHAFIIEAKGYSLREPLRDPNKAFVRIKDDFEKSIGYGYTQTRRVEQKFINKESLIVTDNKGKIIEEIDTTQFEYDFSIIVNINSFGQIQNDLSSLIKIDVENDVYPWVVKIDDLEIFLLTLSAMNKTPDILIDYLLMREDLHGKLICTDELEICGGFLEGKINSKLVEKSDKIITTPDLVSIFDIQYNKGMGFKNEKLWEEKKGGKHHFWG
jgi:hypothetical protein